MSKLSSLKILEPAGVTFLWVMIIALLTIWIAKGDPLALAQLGTKYDKENPLGTEGYDGQFSYYIARDFYPEIVQKNLDVPAYRYQRILFPLLARLISGANLNLIPWVLIGLGIISQIVGTFFLSRLFINWGMNPWYSLIYGLWAGFSLAVRLDLPETLAFALIILAIWFKERGSPLFSWISFGLALFAKEVTITFILAGIFSAVLQKKHHDILGLIGIVVLPYGLFQMWLYHEFGAFGLGSGGAMATQFEVIPFMGFFRIGFYSIFYLIMMGIVFIPSVIFPSSWGLWQGIKDILNKECSFYTIALLINCLAIVTLPFSTFRETGGLLRFACGLVLAIILYAGYKHQLRTLNYGFLWLVLNVFLLK